MYILDICIILISFALIIYFRYKTILRKNTLTMLFIVQSDYKFTLNQLIDISSAGILHLYKLNLYKRNKATLETWELGTSAKLFYKSTKSQLESCIKICELLKVTYVILKLKDNSPGLLAIGPVSSKRVEKVTKNLVVIE
jgi:peptidyl-tRNA hydrolase